MRAATTVIGARLSFPTRGAARLAAFTSGALAGRNAVLSLVTSLERLGSPLTAAKVPTIHTMRMIQRNLTVKRPSPVKNLCIRSLAPCRSRVVPTSLCLRRNGSSPALEDSPALAGGTGLVRSQLRYDTRSGTVAPGYQRVTLLLARLELANERVSSPRPEPDHQSIIKVPGEIGYRGNPRFTP